jgi:hypothetical protein
MKTQSKVKKSRAIASPIVGVLVAISISTIVFTAENSLSASRKIRQTQNAQEDAATSAIMAVKDSIACALDLNVEIKKAMHKGLFQAGVRCSNQDSLVILERDCRELGFDASVYPRQSSIILTWNM